MNLHFTKMHGLGNDFIVVHWPSPDPLPPEITTRLCDRHTGIGADGILLLVPTQRADIQMIVLNADGSRPEMCGNGLRCAAFHTASSTHPHSASVPITVLTDVGLRACLVEPVTPDLALVSADMGTYSEPAPLRLHAADTQLDLLVVSMGNPHAVLFTPDADTTFDALAPHVARHPHFETGVNATFARLLEPNHLQLHVWERGVGPTLACGTAACATAAAALSRGLVDPTRPITARLPGGELTIEIQPDSRTLRLRGPATRVFEGDVSIP